MKATIKNIIVIAVLGSGFAAIPTQAAQSEHQRYLIQKAMKAKQEAKQQQAKAEDQKVCDKSSEASASETNKSSN